MATKIDQKEYLKRYLCNDKERKKRKKKEKKALAKVNVRIIDDDLDLTKLQSIQDNEVDLFALGEEAPQVVGIIDDRPAEMRAKEDFGSNKWKVVASNDGFDTRLEVTDVSKRRVDAEMSAEKNGNCDSAGRTKREDADESPPRKPASGSRMRGRKDSDQSPPRKTSDGTDSGKRRVTADSPMRRRRDSDESPPRKQQQACSTSRSRGRREDSDESPPRKTKHRSHGANQNRRNDSGYDKSSNKRSNSNINPRRNSRQQDSDESPPRRKRTEDKTSDRSKRRHDSDESPPRRTSVRESDKSRTGKHPGDKKRNASPPRKNRHENPRLNSRREDSDESPPRRSHQKQSGNYAQREGERNDRRRRESHDSPPSRRRHGSQEGSSRRSLAKPNRDVSPGPSVRVKEEKNRSDSDLSPPRKAGRSGRPDSDESPPRRRRNTGRTSRSPARHRAPVPPVRVKEERRSSGEESPPRDAATGRMTKTLEGKRAGLQDARALRDENEKHRRREAEAFEKMATEHTGRFAETVVRQKSGRRKDIEKELREEFEKRKHEEKKKEIYTRWGKGVKQVEDYNTRLQEAAHEMDKPLARYADDKDLDEHLKHQERDGDPMLEYLRSKRKEENKRAGIPELPTYQGAFPDNRYGIRPGYRWDGVDRSNGFEKRWFESLSKKKATEEEAYKYSVEDM